MIDKDAKAALSSTLQDNDLIMVDLFFINDNAIKSIDVVESMNKIYYLEARAPTEEELKKAKSSMSRQQVIKLISTNENYVPLYDVYTSNIYIINKQNVYARIINGNYRFPDDIIINTIKKNKKQYQQKLKKHPEMKKNPVFVRKLRKTKLMLHFMDNFDKNELYATYLKVFYRYAPDIGNATYTCIRKSFIPHMGHLTPYYTKDEVLKLGMNQEIISLPNNTTYVAYKDELTQANYSKLCEQVVKNDISSKILIDHQKYIISKDCTGLIQYYTAQGSYFMNRYLRNMVAHSYQDDHLEANIKKVWELILEAPPFDNSYYLYRFVEDDSYIQSIQVGDIFVEPGFTSTTRDPFYRNDLYKFGFILMKIRIPKNTRGVGLCLELLSHFPNEQEIILPPNVELKLVGKNENCIYYHPNEEYASQIKTKYEFEWQRNGHIMFPLREKFNKTKVINFLNIEQNTTLTLKEKIDIMVRTYFDPMNRVKCKIGDYLFYVVAEWYDSTGAYKDMYGIKTSDGFCLYSIYDGYIVFFIEIGESDGYRKMAVNYMNRYTHSKIIHAYTDTEFIKFISEMAYYFDVGHITLYAEYAGCGIVSKQRPFIEKGSDIIIDADEYVGGSYCVDYYKYLKDNWKRFSDINTLHTELYAKFSYDDLDALKNVAPSEILKKEDRDEIYQIYTKTYLLTNNENNLAKFYCWMVENVCYLIDILVDKFSRYFRKDDPFKKDIYILDPITYLYNRKHIHIYSRHLLFDVDEERYPQNLPKNRYRNQRNT